MAQLTIDGSVLREPDMDVSGPYPINEHTVEQLLTYLRQLDRKILDAEVLAEDFGSKSQLARKAVRLFHTKFCDIHAPKTDILFKEWSRIFGIVYGENMSKAEEEASKLGSYYGIQNNLEVKSILFSIHTYFALLMKMLAAEVLVMQYEGLLSSLAKAWSLQVDKDLLNDLIFLESGGLFKKFGVTNFLEGDFFSWYLEEWDEEIASVIRNMAGVLSEYEPATTRLENDHVKDLLKKLYQYLVPKTIRHDLGEYYTTDWLAEYLLNRLPYDGNPSLRVLDPACGSGTFLSLVLKKITKYIDKSKGDHTDILNMILQNVVGYDINPIAVLAARTNYLVAISVLGKLGEGDIEIPIYQSDSILTPRTYAQLLQGNYVLNTVAGEFKIPKSIAKKEIIGEILDLLDRVVGKNGSEEMFLGLVKNYLNEQTYDEVRQHLLELFVQIDKLREEGRNHIWTRIIKNNFAPIYMGTFDYVIGNPPWIRWGYLSQDYRNATLQLWKNYGLFSLKGMQARLGSGEKDFSMLFLYSCVDTYLRNGTLAFLITQEVVKSKGAGEGFRRFKLNPSDGYMKVVEFHDLVAIQPFEGASNKTGLIIITKGDETRYPIPYFRITKPKNFKLEPSMNIQDVMSRLIIDERQAYPVKGIVGSWQDTPTALKDAMTKMRGSSFYKAYRGVSIEPYGVMYIGILKVLHKGDSVYVENLPSLGKKEIKSTKDVIETDLVYPILRGSDIKRWYSKPVIYAIIAQDRETREGYSEQWMLKNTPKTYDYLSGFKQELLDRESYWKYFSKDIITDKKLDTGAINQGKYIRLNDVKNGKYFYQCSNAAFYTMFNVSGYTFADYRVIWSRMANDMKAAVVTKFKTPFGEKEVLGTDTTALIPFDNEMEAHFVCGILNSGIARYFIRSFSSGGRGFGAPSILENILIPQYNNENRLHKKIASLSKQAHIHATNSIENELSQDEISINNQVAKLYKINKMEMKSMM